MGGSAVPQHKPATSMNVEVTIALLFLQSHVLATCVGSSRCTHKSEPYHDKEKQGIGQYDQSLKTITSRVVESQQQTEINKSKNTNMQMVDCFLTAVLGPPFADLDVFVLTGSAVADLNVFVLTGSSKLAKSTPGPRAVALQKAFIVQVKLMPARDFPYTSSAGHHTSPSHCFETRESYFTNP